MRQQKPFSFVVQLPITLVLYQIQHRKISNQVSSSPSFFSTAFPSVPSGLGFLTSRIFGIPKVILFALTDGDGQSIPSNTQFFRGGPRRESGCFIRLPTKLPFLLYNLTGGLEGIGGMRRGVTLRFVRGESTAELFTIAGSGRVTWGTGPQHNILRARGYPDTQGGEIGILVVRGAKID